jgi:hypothetical protein
LGQIELLPQRQYIKGKPWSIWVNEEKIDKEQQKYLYDFERNE